MEKTILSLNDFLITREPIEEASLNIKSSTNFSINLSTEFDQDLEAERIAREFISLIQKMRKEQLLL